MLIDAVNADWCWKMLILINTDADWIWCRLILMLIDSLRDLRLLEAKVQREAPDRLLLDRDQGSATYCVRSKSPLLQVLTCDWEACSEFLNVNNCKKFLTWSLSNVLSASYKKGTIKEQILIPCPPPPPTWKSFLGKDISGSHASQECQEHGEEPGGPGALLLRHPGNWTPRLWTPITCACPVLLSKLTCADLNNGGLYTQLIINCIHLSRSNPLFILICVWNFSHFYRCNIPPTSPWHHSSVQHPQSSLSSPHQHFLSKSPHPQDAEKLCNHISWWRYNISANISTPHLVKELGDIVNLVVYNRPNWFVGSPSYIVLLHFFQPKHLHFASHPQMAWSLWNKKLCTECHV